MNLFQPQFSDTLDRPRTALRKTILVASTPRSGSHMLGHAMAATGALGVPYEYLNPANLEEWRRRLGPGAPLAILRKIIDRRTTENGVFALKAHFDHAESFGGASALLAALPDVSVVHIRRGDVLRQAISYAIARQTGVWIAGQQATGGAARFDAALIDRCLRDIALQNARWQTAFRAAGITALPLFYEDIASDLSGAIRRIADHAGLTVETPDIAAAPRTRRQSRAAETDAWVDRYGAALQQDIPAHLTRIRKRIARSLAAARA